MSNVIAFKPLSKCANHSSIKECVKSVGKGTGIGFALGYAPSVVRGKFKQFRISMALAILFGGFRLSNCSLQRIAASLTKNSKSSKLLSHYSIPISAFVSSFSALQLDDKGMLNNLSLMIWLIVKASKPYIGLFDKQWKVVLIMCISASQILSTWISRPYEHAPSYLKFLDVQGGKSRTEVLWKAEEEYQFDLPQACPFIHPGQSCTNHAFWFWIRGLWRALPVYLPLHLISFLFSKKHSVSKLLIGLFRSCAFLSTYCTLSWASSCAFFKIWPGVNRQHLFMFCWIPGLALLIETPHRRSEISAYCFTHALHSMLSYSIRKKWISISPTLNSFLISSTLSWLFHDTSKLPLFFTKHVLGIEN